MVNLTPSQLAVLNGGVKYIKDNLKKRPNRSRKQRRNSRGTMKRRRQRGGTISLSKIVESLFLACLFGSLLIQMGVERPLGLMVQTITSKAGLVVEAGSVSEFIEWFVILIMFPYVDWSKMPGGRPNMCKEGVRDWWFTTTEVTPEFSKTCPQRSQQLEIALVSMLFGMLTGIVGPKVLDFMSMIVLPPFMRADVKPSSSEAVIANEAEDRLAPLTIREDEIDQAGRKIAADLNARSRPPGTAKPDWEARKKRHHKRRAQIAEDYFKNPELPPGETKSPSSAPAPIEPSLVSISPDALVDLIHTEEAQDMINTPQGKRFMKRAYEIAIETQQSPNFREIGGRMTNAVEDVSGEGTDAVPIELTFRPLLDYHTQQTKKAREAREAREAKRLAIEDASSPGLPETATTTTTTTGEETDAETDAGTGGRRRKKKKQTKRKKRSSSSKKSRKKR